MSAASEAQIQQLIIGALKGRPDIFAWRQSAGGRGRFKFGKKGQADISGIIRPWGIRLEIEVKTKKGKLSDEQEAFGDMIRRSGGVYIVTSDLDEMLAELDRQIALIREVFDPPKKTTKK